MTQHNSSIVSPNPDLKRLLKMSKPTYVPPTEMEQAVYQSQYSQANHNNTANRQHNNNSSVNSYQNNTANNDYAPPAVAPNENLDQLLTTNRSPLSVNIRTAVNKNINLIGLFGVIALWVNDEYIPAIIATTITSLVLGTIVHKFIDINKHSDIFDNFTKNFKAILIVLFVTSFIIFNPFLLLLAIFIIITTALYRTTNIEQNSGNNAQLKRQQPAIEQDNSSNTTFSYPLTVRKDANNLHILLSHQAMPVLENLIYAVNELYDNLPYLQDNHPYLATSVQELIKDIHSNSIVHLDSIAKEFVHDGYAEPHAKQVFINTHERNIVHLFQSHLADVKELNASILEKKMAGFSQIGTDAERQFRDKIMELKIVLRWHIAQHADDESGIAHEVILNNLQQSTLKQMMTVFHHASTTNPQRIQLLKQIDALLKHFQSQSAMSYKTENNDILRLSNNAGVPLDANTNDQLAMQEFIDFNEQYVKQLQRHW